MDSVLHQLFSGQFLSQDWDAHRKETVSHRMAAYQTRFSSVIQQTDDGLKERWLHVMEELVHGQLEEQPDMFHLGWGEIIHCVKNALLSGRKAGRWCYSRLLAILTMRLVPRREAPSLMNCSASSMEEMPPAALIFT